MGPLVLRGSGLPVIKMVTHPGANGSRDETSALPLSQTDTCTDMYLCLGCEYVVLRRTDGGDCRGEVGTTQASGATGPDAGRLQARLVSYSSVFNVPLCHLIMTHQTNNNSSISNEEQKSQ